MHLKIFGSSSSGNCALLQSAGCNALIDAGFSARKTASFLKDCGLGWNDIHAVFLTHSHSDHCKGIRQLYRHPHISVFASELALPNLHPYYERPPQFKCFEIGQSWSFRDLEVSSFFVPHDTGDTCGFCFRAAGESHTLVWATDLGHIPSEIAGILRRADTLALECNYDEQMLEESSRPWHLKNRIRGLAGHLSLQEVYGFVSQSTQAAWRQVVLLHQSRECNSYELVAQSFAPFRTRFEVFIPHPEELAALPQIEI